MNRKHPNSGNEQDMCLSTPSCSAM